MCGRRHLSLVLIREHFYEHIKIAGILFKCFTIPHTLSDQNCFLNYLVVMVYQLPKILLTQQNIVALTEKLLKQPILS